VNLHSKVAIPEEVMTRRVGDETVILDLATGTYFGLDRVGADMWQLMGEGRTLAEVCDAMLARYETTRADLERDVLELAEKLRAQGLVRPG
jgi:hypothetical protein